MHAWARELKAKTDAGAVLFWDGELWPDPEWTIEDHVIFFSSGDKAQMLMEPEDDPDETLREIKGRLRVLVDA